MGIVALLNGEVWMVQTSVINHSIPVPVQHTFTMRRCLGPSLPTSWCWGALSVLAGMISVLVPRTCALTLMALLLGTKGPKGVTCTKNLAATVWYQGFELIILEFGFKCWR